MLRAGALLQACSSPPSAAPQHTWRAQRSGHVVLPIKRVHEHKVVRLLLLLLLLLLPASLLLPQKDGGIDAVQAEVGQVGGQAHGLRGGCHHGGVQLHGVNVCGGDWQSKKIRQSRP